VGCCNGNPFLVGVYYCPVLNTLVPAIGEDLLEINNVKRLMVYVMQSEISTCMCYHYIVTPFLSITYGVTVKPNYLYNIAYVDDECSVHGLHREPFSILSDL